MMEPMKSLLFYMLWWCCFFDTAIGKTGTRETDNTAKIICKYAPQKVACPERSLIRNGETGLCRAETEYMNKRYELHIRKNLMTFLQKCDIPGLSVSKYMHEVKRAPPAIGVSLSGGGYRSFLISAGVLQQMERLELLPCINYMTSVSGGTWLLAKLILQEFEDLQLTTWDFQSSLLEGVPNFELSDEEVGDSDLIAYKPLLKDNNSEDSSSLVTTIEKRGFLDQYKILKIKLNLFINNKANDRVTNITPLIDFLDNLATLQKTFHFYESIHTELKEKRLLGFPVSFTDYWGRALSRRMQKPINDASNEHLALSVGKFHDVTVKNSKKFKNSGMPFPIIVANCKNKPQMTNVVFEFSPFEFGSFHYSLNKFVEIKYLGSKIENGKSVECYSGFDDLGFIAATSSSLFNNILAVVWEMVRTCSKETIEAMSTLLNSFGLSVERPPLGNQNASEETKIKPDYAVFHPNPFYISEDDQTKNKDSTLTSENHLYLVDGGEDGENVPLRPLLKAERRMDIVFAVDSSSDAKTWPSGKNMHSLFLHMQAENDTRTVNWKNKLIQILNIPRIPKAITDRSKPMVFGCAVEKYIYSVKNKNIQSEHKVNVLPPMIIYIPNFPHVFSSNTSTFKTQYNRTEIAKMMQNGGAMLLPETADSLEAAYFQKCLACFIIKRSFDNGIAFGNPPKFCDLCYKAYCYN